MSHQYWHFRPQTLSQIKSELSWTLRLPRWVICPRIPLAPPSLSSALRLIFPRVTNLSLSRARANRSPVTIDGIFELFDSERLIFLRNTYWRRLIATGTARLLNVSLWHEADQLDGPLSYQLLSLSGHQKRSERCLDEYPAFSMMPDPNRDEAQKRNIQRRPLAKEG